MPTCPEVIRPVSQHCREFTASISRATAYLPILDDIYHCDYGDTSCRHARTPEAFVEAGLVEAVSSLLQKFEASAAAAAQEAKSAIAAALARKTQGTKSRENLNLKQHVTLSKNGSSKDIARTGSAKELLVKNGSSKELVKNSSIKELSSNKGSTKNLLQSSGSMDEVRHRN